MKRLIYTVLCATAIFLPTIASAGEIRHRETLEQQRIHHGVQQGTINQRERRNLERREAALDAARRRDLLNHHGRLTANERRQLNHRENQISRDIYRDRHN